MKRRDVAPKKPVLGDFDLSNFDVILLGETGFIKIDKPGIENLKTFMFHGDRVILTANAFYVGTVRKTRNPNLEIEIQVSNSSLC